MQRAVATQSKPEIGANLVQGEAMTVKEIVIEYLKANGYDGLCREECGCGLNDLCPCDDNPYFDCEPAYHHEATADREEGWYPDKPEKRPGEKGLDYPLCGDCIHFNNGICPFCEDRIIDADDDACEEFSLKGVE